MAEMIVLVCTHCGKSYEKKLSLYRPDAPRGQFCCWDHWIAHTKRRYEQFWDFVDKTPGHGPKGDCWVWLGSKGYKGYGTIGYDGKDLYAHRRAYELTRGSIPADKPEIRHTCDFPPCCNPEHLIPGTHADNGRDMAERERSPTTKLTASQVIQIRQDPRSDAILAREYGVGRSTIYNIRQRNSWRHIP